MSHLQVAFAVGAAIVLFVYGLQGFGVGALATVLLPWLASWALAGASDPGMAVAWAHLAFNLGMAAMLLPTMPWVAPWLQRVLKVSDDARG